MAAYLWHTTSCDTGRYDKTRRMSSSLSLEKRSTLVVRTRFSSRLESTASSSRDLFTILEENADPCVLRKSPKFATLMFLAPPRCPPLAGFGSGLASKQRTALCLGIGGCARSASTCATASSCLERRRTMSFPISMSYQCTLLKTSLRSAVYGFVMAGI